MLPVVLLLCVSIELGVPRESELQEIEMARLGGIP